MEANLSYEIKAEAFRRMTGHMAPGKDPGMLGGESLSYDERLALWLDWLKTHGEVISAMIMAVDAMTPNEPTEA